MNSSNRLQSLDIMRGLTVAAMILVNNGAGHEHFPQLVHSKWHGLTLCDLVFPFFLFMVGVSISYALGKYSPDYPQVMPQEKHAALRKILIRSGKMFLIGLLLHVWDMWIGGKEDILAHIRIWGVLQRIALCYMAVSLIVLYVKSAHYWYICIALFMGYNALMYYGNGYLPDAHNIAAVVDRALVGEAHLYSKSPIDPEGLVGTISAIAHTLIGASIGRLLKAQTPLSLRLKILGLTGLMLVISGYLLSSGIPFNKRIWSTSYAILTCGLGTLLLTTLTWLVDAKQAQRVFHPFLWFGRNAIILYVGSEILSPLIGRWDIPEAIHGAYCAWGLSAQWASLTYALTYVSLMAALAALLFWRKIFVKL